MRTPRRLRRERDELREKLDRRDAASARPSKRARHHEDDAEGTGPGDRVFALFERDKWWGGTVIKTSGADEELRFDVVFDDGDQQKVWANDMLAMPPPGHKPAAMGPNAAARALLAAAAREGGFTLTEERTPDSDSWGDPGVVVPAKKPRGAPKPRAPPGQIEGDGPKTFLALGGAETVRSWRSTLTPDAWDALATADGLTRNNVPARGWHRGLKLRKASGRKCDVFFHPPGQLVSREALRSKPEISRYLATNATPLFEAPQLEDFSFALDDNLALFPTPPKGYYTRLRSQVAGLLRPASAVLPAAALALLPAAPALPLAPPPTPYSAPVAAPSPAAQRVKTQASKPNVSAFAPPAPALSEATSAPSVTPLPPAADPDGEDAAWPVVGSHVQLDNGIRGVVTQLPMPRANYYEVTTKTGYASSFLRQDLTRTTLTDEEAALCDRSRLTAPEWFQAQIDGAVCVTYKGREFGNGFETKDGRTQRMFTVQNGDVHCALCDWIAPNGGVSSALQNDLSARAWSKWFNSIKSHCGGYASHQSKAIEQHVERVLAMAAEPSPQRRPPVRPARPAGLEPSRPAAVGRKHKPPTGPRRGSGARWVAAAPYPVESLVEARFRGGDVFYPALVIAARNGGTVDLKYTDGDFEERVPLDLVRPLAPRQRSVPDAPAAAPKSKPKPVAPKSKPKRELTAPPRWTPEEEKQLRKLAGELGDARESWSAIAERLGSVRSAQACEAHWKSYMKGKTRPAPAPVSVDADATRRGKACEVRRGTGPWRRFASQVDAYREIPALSQTTLSLLVSESRDGVHRVACNSIRGVYEARDYFGTDFGARDVGSSAKPVPNPRVTTASKPLAIAATESFGRGARVIAPWTDGRKYSATVISGTPLATRIVFEDGQLHTVPAAQLEVDKRPQRPSSPGVPPPPRGSRVVVKFEDEEHHGVIDVVIDDRRALVQFDDGEAEAVRFPDPDVRVTRLAAPADEESARTEPTGDLCAICLEPLSTAAPQLSECGHRLHASCLAGAESSLVSHAWADSAPSTRRGQRVMCPTCRTHSWVPPGLNG